MFGIGVLMHQLNHIDHDRILGNTHSSLTIQLNLNILCCAMRQTQLGHTRHSDHLMNKRSEYRQLMNPIHIKSFNPVTIQATVAAFCISTVTLHQLRANSLLNIHIFGSQHNSKIECGGGCIGASSQQRTHIRLHFRICQFFMNVIYVIHRLLIRVLVRLIGALLFESLTNSASTLDQLQYFVIRTERIEFDQQECVFRQHRVYESRLEQLECLGDHSDHLFVKGIVDGNVSAIVGVEYRVECTPSHQFHGIPHLIVGGELVEGGEHDVGDRFVHDFVDERGSAHSEQDGLGQLPAFLPLLAVEVGEWSSAIGGVFNMDL
mmetsp:Transcript_74375/g.118410  ORF Transcript_74375/g.118410 Transcript_74375/m.118410 type:complete len:320 (+) Transcript_74375:15-974(+)